MIEARKFKNLNNLFQQTILSFSTTKGTRGFYDTLDVKDQVEWRQWLDKNHNKIEGVWLKIYKKAAIGTPLKYDEALDHALCYGWIDGQRKKYDDASFLQKFTPRR